MFGIFPKSEEPGILNKARQRVASDLAFHREQSERLKSQISDLSTQLSEHDSAAAAMQDALNTFEMHENMSQALAASPIEEKAERSLLRPASSASSPAIQSETRNFKPQSFA